MPKLVNSTLFAFFGRERSHALTKRTRFRPFGNRFGARKTHRVKVVLCAVIWNKCRCECYGAQKHFKSSELFAFRRVAKAFTKFENRIEFQNDRVCMCVFSSIVNWMGMMIAIGIRTTQTANKWKCIVSKYYMPGNGAERTQKNSGEGLSAKKSRRNVL